MTGFQIFLLIIASIVFLIWLVLSVPVKVHLGFDDKIRVSIKYLFIKLDILPASPKPKKEKQPKEPKPEKEEPAEKEKVPKEKRPNPIVEMVKANGYDGMMTVIGNLGRVLGVYGGKLFKSIVFDRLDLHIVVGTGDSAATAIKYGKTCQKVYPVMGFICSNNLVRKYDINVEPDFLANDTKGEFYCDMNICIRKIINSSIGLGVRLVFKVLLVFIKGGRTKNKENNETNHITMKG